MRFSQFYEKLFAEMETVDERVMSRAARRKVGIRMKRLAKSAGFKKKKERAMKKMPTADKIKKLGRKAAKKKLRSKYFPKYDSMGVNQKIKADELIQKRFGGAIDKIAKKMVPSIKKKAMARVKALRAKKAEE
jgi:hypothetical protein